MGSMRRFAMRAVWILAFFVAHAPASAQIRAAVVAQGLSLPVAFVQNPSTPAVQFIVEQGGRIRVLQNGLLLASNFLDLSTAISTGGERGLLGLAFPSDYSTSGRFYVNFTDLNGDTVVARFKRSSTNALAADPASRFDLLWSTGERVIRQPFPNHNGGHIEFGADGFLYVGMGDGGSANDPGNRAQDPNALLGKMLRIDVSVADADVKGFRIPADNPFLDGQPIAALPEIWAFGMRNPWRFSFDDTALGGTGAMIIGDVGQGAWEEIDYEPVQTHGGRNYGWRIREGLHPNVTTLPAAYLPLTDPIFEYDHTTGVAIIGGAVYRGQTLGTSLRGRYLYGDLNGRVWSLGLSVDPTTGAATVVDQTEHTAELGGSTFLGSIAAFGVDASGDLYIVQYAAGTILKVVPTPVPSQLTAVVSSANQVALAWTATPNAGSYQIERMTPGGGFLQIATSTTNAFTDTTVVPNTAYLYRVRAVDLIGPSPTSTPRLVTALVFTDNPLVAGTVVKGAHLAELRAAVNAARSLAGLAPAVFTDAMAPGLTIRAVHIVELRQALDQARNTLGLSSPAYTDSTLLGQVFKTAHVQELRLRVQ